MKRKKNNWGLFAVAFFLAVILWGFVVREDNPQVDINLGKVTVEVLNEDVMYNNNLAYQITNNIEVNVTVTVPQADGFKVSASDVKLSADLSNWHPGFVSIPIDVEIVNNNSLIKKYKLSETVLKIKTETMEEKELELSMNIIGSPKEGYAVSESTINLSKVTVKAPSSEMKRVVKAQVDVDIDGFVRSYSGQKDIVLYDGNSDIIDIQKEQIILSEEKADVSIVILKEKELTLKLPTITDCKKGYRCIGTVASVETVKVLGQERRLQHLDSIDLSGEKIDLKDKTNNVERIYNLSEYLPYGIKLATDEPTSVVVTVNIEKLSEKVFSVKPSDIKVDNLPTGRKESFIDSSAKIVVIGFDEDLDKMTIEDLKPTINLKNCKLGEQEIEIGVTLPNELELASLPKIKISVAKE